MKLSEIQRPKGNRVNVDIGYHITTRKNLPNIANHGLMPSNSDNWAITNSFSYERRVYFASSNDRVTLYRLIGLMLAKWKIVLKQNMTREQRLNQDQSIEQQILKSLVLLEVNLKGMDVFIDPDEVEEGVPSIFCEETVPPDRIHIIEFDALFHHTEFVKQFNRYVMKKEGPSPFENPDYEMALNKLK